MCGILQENLINPVICQEYACNILFIYSRSVKVALFVLQSCSMPRKCLSHAWDGACLLFHCLFDSLKAFIFTTTYYWNIPLIIRSYAWHIILENLQPCNFIHLESPTPGQEQTFWYIPVHTSTYQYVPKWESTSLDVLVCTSMY